MVWTVLLLIGMTVVRMRLSALERRMEPQSDSGAASSNAERLKSVGETLEVAIISVAVIFLVVRPFVVQAFYIPSGSMSPTLQENDRVLVNKLAYRFSEPQRNDVIVFTAPEGADPKDDPEEKELVKRVIALPGEVVEVTHGQTLVNGSALPGRTAQEATDYDFAPYTVPEGKLFVLGDNRNHSSDSHLWGAVDRSRVVGRASYIFWPPSRAGAIH